MLCKVVSKDVDSYYILKAKDVKLVVAKMVAKKKTNTGEIGYLLDADNSLYVVPVDKLILHRVVFMKRFFDSNLNEIPIEKLYTV